MEKYSEFVNNYEDFLYQKWIDSTQYSDDVSNAFLYFYKNLIHGKIFNDYIGSEDNAIKKFRDSITLESTCPYCDYHEMEFDSSSVDHFVPKSRHPILAIYPKNLVVACSACNDRLKKEKIRLPIFHPYYTNLDDYFYFTFKDEKIFINFDEGIPTEDKERVINFLELFEIEQRYNKYCKRKLISLKKEVIGRVSEQIRLRKTMTSSISNNTIENLIEE
ncbi:HNH endonuclease, partial [Terribacillus saccharophilus]|uniref:HNH endonuclease n=1 Tax=Terribacillus saccharophilus TaxID=361277 RepID=UPI001596199F